MRLVNVMTGLSYLEARGEYLVVEPALEGPVLELTHPYLEAGGEYLVVEPALEGPVLELTLPYLEA